MDEQFLDRLAEFAVAPNARGRNLFYRQALMNWFGCTLAGAGRHTVDVLVAYHGADGTSRLSPPIGRTERLSASAALTVDCLSSSVLAYDDIHFATTVHPAGPVAAAIYGLSRLRPVNGGEALEALCVGMEIECRIATAMFGRNTGAAQGYYPTGIAGGVGAAAAVGRLLGQDAATLKSSMGLASAKASGTRGTHGNMSAFWPPAVAAEAGYSAAMMVSAGFACPPAALYGPMGLIQQIAPRPDIEGALQGLGEAYSCETTACKIFPYGFISYAAIDCARSLASNERAAGRKLESISLSVSPVCAKLGNKPVPANMFEAQVSLNYIVARILVDPDLAFEPLAEDFGPEPVYTEISQRVEVMADQLLRNDQCRLAARYADGEELTTVCEAAPGSSAALVRSADLRAKFLRLVTPSRGASQAQRLLAQFDLLEELEDLSGLQ